MKTIELKIADNLFEKILNLLEKFPKKDLKIIDKTKKKEALNLLQEIQAEARQSKLDRLTDAEIDAEIDAYRKAEKQKS